MFDWDLEAFVRENVDDSEEAVTAIQLLAVEYDDDGANEKFRSVMQGTVCTMGSASQRTMRMYKALGLGTVPLGGTIGSLDCHLGGIEGSCSESAACISWNSRSTDSASSSFLISCLLDSDVVSINGERITRSMGSLPLGNQDVVSVGSRVFVFLPVNGEYS